MTLEILLDPQTRAEAVGADVRLTRLRHKPGFSTIAATHRGDGPADGWVQVVADEHRVKIDNAVRRADRLGVPVRVTRIGTCLAAAGPIAADGRLGRLVARFRAEPTGEDRTLNYNPHKRWVVRQGSDVLRVTREPQPDWAPLTRSLPSAVLRPRPSGPTEDDRISRWPFVIGTPLTEPADATRLGTVLAALHATEPPDGVGLWNAESVLVPARAADQLLPGLGAEATMAPLAAWAADRPDRALAHGDFSADQVVVDGSGAPRLLDLDRLTVAPRGLDAGTFAAVAGFAEDAAGLAEDGLVTGLLAGYGPVPELERWTALARAQRILDPLRTAELDWRERVADRVREVRALWNC